MPSKPRNPYQTLLDGHFKARYEEIQRYTPEELVLANFQAIQALLAWEMDGRRTFDGEKRTVMAALDVLVEQEQISEEYAQFVRMTLAGWSLERLTNIASQAQSLPLTAARLRQDGDTQAQVKILQDFLVQIMCLVDSREARTLGMQTLSRLKLEAGLSNDSMNRMIGLIEAADEEDDEPEEEAVDVDGEEVAEDEAGDPDENLDEDPWGDDSD